MGGGKSSGSQSNQVQLTPEQKETLQIQNKALKETFLPAYQETVTGAKDVYGRISPAVTNAANTAMGVAGRSGALQEAVGAGSLATGTAGLAGLFDPQYEQQQVDAALQAGRESGRELVNQQVAGYGAAGGLGSSRAALADANLASLQEQRQATAAAEARAKVQANKASAAGALISAGQTGLTNAQQAAASRVNLAASPQDVYSKYASVVFGVPQGSTTPNYAGTQSSIGSGSSKGFGGSFKLPGMG